MTRSSVLPVMSARNKSGGEYVYVNPTKVTFRYHKEQCQSIIVQEGPPSWGEMTNNAAHGLFITELGRGMAVTLGHIFKEPATINYPFEKGPLSPRFRGEHALRRCCKITLESGSEVLTNDDPYMQKTCDVAGKAILVKKNLRKKCVNRDKSA